MLHYTKTETVSIQPYISSKTNYAEMHNFSNTAPLEICRLSVIDLTQFITSGSNDWVTGVNEVDKLLIVSVACQYCLLELNQREFIEREKPTEDSLVQKSVKLTFLLAAVVVMQEFSIGASGREIIFIVLHD